MIAPLGSVTSPLVAAATTALRTWAGEALGCVSRYRAKTPATCGAAKEVPDATFCTSLSTVPSGLTRGLYQADRMFTPGAKMSMQRPQFENVARRSVVASMAPTVTASGTRAGEKLQASMLALPAATTTATPAPMTRWTAASIDESGLPPIDR